MEVAIAVVALLSLLMNAVQAHALKAVEKDSDVWRRVAEEESKQAFAAVKLLHEVRTLLDAPHQEEGKA